MNTNKKAYETIELYVKKIGFGKTFTANDIRERVSKVEGFNPRGLGGLVRKAINRGMFVNIGVTQSTVPNHKGGPVSVYAR